MITKTRLALTALLMLGIASAAQAAGKDDADSLGGSPIGPLGQSFRHGPGEAFGYVPRTGTMLRDDGVCWAMTANGNYARTGCPQ